MASQRRYTTKVLPQFYYYASLPRKKSCYFGADGVQSSTRSRANYYSARNSCSGGGAGTGTDHHLGQIICGATSWNDNHPRWLWQRHSSTSTSSNTRNRKFSTSTEETAPFDRHLKNNQRTRAAEKCRQYYSHYLQSMANRRSANDKIIHTKKPIIPYDYFHKEVASRLVERLDDIHVRDEGFPLALEVGASANFVYDAIVEGCNDDTDDLWRLDNEENENVMFVGGRGGIRKLVQMDACAAMLHRDELFAEDVERSTSSNGDYNSNHNTTICETYKLVNDFDGGSGSGSNNTPLPFPDATFDLVISSMAFHWVNNLPKLLSEIERVLKPDGCLLFALPGGNTLPELRSSLVLSELERTGGVSTHVGPYVDLSNIGSLLTGTGFRLPTIDIDDIQIGYPNAMVLMEHLGRMGEGNACTNRKERVGLSTFLGAACLYRELYPMKDEEVECGDARGGNEEGGIIASAQIIYGISWKEHASQQQPEGRGSATHKLTDISVTNTYAKSE
jgi:NADH dehydrogenase [ubiquinone] 1 alpha subcomplex assembly factor 5